VQTYTANAVALYNILPQGAFTADQLLAMRTVPTALAYLTGNSTYSLSFFLDAQNRVCINTPSGQPPVCIVASHVGCDGILHETLGLLLPTPSVYGLDVNATIYDIPADQLTAPPAVCNTTLIEAMEAAPDLTLATNFAKGSPTMMQLFNSTQTEVTYFAVTDDGYQKVVGEWADGGHACNALLFW